MECPYCGCLWGQDVCGECGCHNTLDEPPEAGDPDAGPRWLYCPDVDFYAVDWW